MLARQLEGRFAHSDENFGTSQSKATPDACCHHEHQD